MKDLNAYITESSNPFQGSKIRNVVYRCGEELKKDKFIDVIWFSNKPIGYFGRSHTYYIDLQHPLIIDAKGCSWSDKLWWECCDEDGVPNINPHDRKLTSKMPAEFWKKAQDTDIEIEYGDIPYIAKNMGKWDGVVMKNIFETPACNVEVDDYIIFSINQMQPA